MNLDDVLRVALALPVPGRARLVAELLESLRDEAPDAGRDAAWAEELAIRLERYDAGAAATVSGETLLADLRGIARGAAP